MTTLHVRRAFTLVEAVMVVALIALASCLLFPYLSSQTAKERASSCFSNEKQLLMATWQYAEDYDDRLPPRNYNMLRQTAAPDVTWHDLISAYLKSDAVFTCPEAPTLTRVPHDLGRPGGYLINNVGQAVGDPPFKRTGTPWSGLWNCAVPMALGELEMPSCTVLYSDGVPDSHGDVIGANRVMLGRKFGLGDQPTGSQQTNRLFVSRHGAGGLFAERTCQQLPYAFADGHVKMYPLDPDLFLVRKPKR
ncbi:MAG: type II secretion system protein [Armatimonadetes bacterium]|nr:type II secretion system protein [Armatimonadota bacterium]